MNYITPMMALISLGTGLILTIEIGFRVPVKVLLTPSSESMFRCKYASPQVAKVDYPYSLAFALYDYCEEKRSLR